MSLDGRVRIWPAGSSDAAADVPLDALQVAGYSGDEGRGRALRCAHLIVFTVFLPYAVLIAIPGASMVGYVVLLAGHGHALARLLMAGWILATLPWACSIFAL